MTLKPVSIAQFRREWSFYRECLEKIKAIRGGSWRPEDVYAAVVNREAYPWTFPEGFMILKPIQDDYDGTPILLIWIAWGESTEHLLEKYREQTLEIARADGFERIQFYRAPKGVVEGWRGIRKAYTIYELDV